MVEEFTTRSILIRKVYPLLFITFAALRLLYGAFHQGGNLFKKEGKFVLSERSSIRRIFVQILSWVVSRNFSGIWGSILGKCHFLVVYFFFIKKDIFFSKFEKWTIILNLGLGYIKKLHLCTIYTPVWFFSITFYKVDGSLFENREQCWGACRPRLLLSLIVYFFAYGNPNLVLKRN